jgi:hypothetical protein
MPEKEYIVTVAWISQADIKVKAQSKKAAELKALSKAEFGRVRAEKGNYIVDIVTEVE